MKFNDDDTVFLIHLLGDNDRIKSYADRENTSVSAIKTSVKNELFKRIDNKAFAGE